MESTKQFYYIMNEDKYIMYIKNTNNILQQLIDEIQTKNILNLNTQFTLINNDCVLLGLSFSEARKLRLFLESNHYIFTYSKN